MAIIMGKGCIEAIYGLMGWKGLIHLPALPCPTSTTSDTTVLGQGLY